METDGEETSKRQRTETLSWKPRVFMYHNFLSKEECEHLIQQAKPHMARSMVMDKVTRERIETTKRTSTGTFLRRGHDDVIKAIEKRIAELTFIPVEHGGSLQVLHYEVGQKYVPHYDYRSKEYAAKHGQRIATVLMYLSDVEEGGETFFPKKGLSVKPKMGL